MPGGWKKNGNGVVWTPDELADLREHYPAGGAAACAIALGRHSPAAIAQQAYKLGVSLTGDARSRATQRRSLHKYRWTEAEDQILREHYPSGVERCLVVLPRYTRQAIFQRARKLGVRIDPQVLAGIRAEVGARKARHLDGPAPHGFGGDGFSANPLAQAMAAIDDLTRARLEAESRELLRELSPRG